MQNLVIHTLELDFMDKSDWARGEWDNEPDKIFWEDAETKLPCLALRGPVGSFNAYVGVPVYHPAYGLSYDGETMHDHNKYSEAFWDQVRKRDKNKSILDSVDYDKLPPKPVVPDIGEKLQNIEVHGGLTFAGPSTVPTKEMWEKAKASVPYNHSQARIFPKGDAAEWMKEWMSVINDYDAWSKHMRERFICYPLSALGSDEVDETWWFGFDTSHYGDLSPRLEGLKGLLRTEVYRNLDYVRGQCASLARQLKALA